MDWEQRRLDRSRRRLQFWAASGKREASRQADVLRQAIADADWDTVECHGGLNVVMEKIDQLEQEKPASNDAGMIDDLRLRGSSTWRTRSGL